MSASWNAIGHEMLFGGVSVVLNLLKIIIPLMILVEILLEYKVIDKIAPRLGWLTKLLGISKHAILPLLVGLFIGITYSAGTLMEIRARGEITKRDMGLLGVFIFSCHGIIEVTVLLVNAGGSIIFIFFVRLVIAILLTAIAARTVFRHKP